MIQKDGSIVINEFPGIGLSPMSGFADFRNLDIFTEPNVARLNIQTVKQSGSTIDALVKWVVQDPTNSDLYALSDNGKVWKSDDDGDTWSQVTGNTTTGAAGNGLGLFVASDGDRFLIVCRNTVVDIYDIGGTSWTSSFGSMTLSSNSYHPVLIGQDNRIYIGNGRYIASIIENTAFDPGSGATYTATTTALDLPSEYAVRCLAELGDRLMIGTTKTDAFGADIFPWDHLSSADTFEKPIKISDDGVKAMISANNLLYVITGNQGNIHITNGSSVQFIRSLPYHNFGFYTGMRVDVMPGAIMRSENQIYFGVSTVASSGTGIGVFGIYGLTMDGKTLTFEYQISTGTVIDTNPLKIGALFPSNYPIIGWRDNTSYGIDTVDLSNNYYTNYAGYFDTPLYAPGSHVAKKTYQDIDILLAKKFTSQQGVRVKYRTNLTDSFTTLVTFDHATHGAVSSINLPAPITDADQLQLRVELTSPASGTPELRQIILR